MTDHDALIYAPISRRKPYLEIKQVPGTFACTVVVGEYEPGMDPLATVYHPCKLVGDVFPSLEMAAIEIEKIGQTWPNSAYPRGRIIIVTDAPIAYSHVDPTVEFYVFDRNGNPGTAIHG